MSRPPTPIVRADPVATAQVDVLVVGAGITGSAIAYEAAARGLSVLLVDRGDFGGATSAATGKLVHGGLRYLKKLEISLVRDSLRERRTLFDIAPTLVAPLPIVLPHPGLLEYAGLTAYDILSADRNRVRDPSRRIPRHRTLRSAQLSGLGLGHVDRALLYYDGVMLSSERLTLAFVRSAVAAGAAVANYTAVTELVGTAGRIEGAIVDDTVTGRSAEVRARITVNATGPWARDVLAGSAATRGQAGPEPAVRSEGIYLVTRRMSDAMVLTVSGHGHFSVAPWRSRSLIGPTETTYHGAVDQWRLTRDSIDRHIAEVNRTSTLPVALTADDVLAAYGGLRPLTESGGVDTYNASRASELIDHARHGQAGLLTAVGGKYTTSRGFAERAVAQIAGILGAPTRRSLTRTTPLDGCAVEDVEAGVAALARTAATQGIGQDTAALLSGLYGQDAATVLALAASDPRLAMRATDDGELLAGVAFAARYEAPVHLTDILLRRTGIGTLGDPGDAVTSAAADVAGEILSWDAPRRARELADARRALRLPED